MVNDTLDKPDMKHYDIDKETYTLNIIKEHRMLAKQLDDGKWEQEVEPIQTVNILFDTKPKK
jgi:hypothetical protein